MYLIWDDKIKKGKINDFQINEKPKLSFKFSYLFFTESEKEYKIDLAAKIENLDDLKTEEIKKYILEYIKNKADKNLRKSRF